MSVSQRLQGYKRRVNPSTREWSIEISDFLGGFAPAWWQNTYSTVGKKNQASNMQNVSLIDPNFITQGPGLANLTNGTQAAAVTTLIKGMLRVPQSSDVAYGVGGAKLYKFSSTAVTNAGDWPHTIDKGAVTGEDGEDVAVFQGALYYSYNHSGSAGDIGKFDLSSTFDDDWGSTVPTGAAALQSAPHPLMVGGDDVLYIGNGRYVATYDGTTLDAVNLDTRIGTQVVDLQYHQDTVFIFSNFPNLTGSNVNEAIIYLWDGIASSWSDSIKIYGRIGAGRIVNGIIYVFYQDVSSTGGYKLGFVNGNRIQEVAHFIGSLPLFYQVFVEEGFLMWESSGLLYAWGSNSHDLPARLFQYADNGHATVGGMTNCFGTPIIASNDGGSNYRLAKHSGYDTACFWYSMNFPVARGSLLGFLDEIDVHYDTLASGARCDLTLKYNRGASSLTVGQIGFTATDTTQAVAFTGSGLNDATSGGIYTGTSNAYYTVIIDATGTPDTFKWSKNGGSYTTGVSITGSAQTLSDGVTVTFAATTGHTLADRWDIGAIPGATQRKIFYPAQGGIEDCSLQLSWANGSASNPASIRSITLRGHYEEV